MTLVARAPPGHLRRAILPNLRILQARQLNRKKTHPKRRDEMTEAENAFRVLRVPLLSTLDNVDSSMEKIVRSLAIFFVKHCYLE